MIVDFSNFRGHPSHGEHNELVWVCEVITVTFLSVQVPYLSERIFNRTSTINRYFSCLDDMKFGALLYGMNVKGFV